MEHFFQRTIHLIWMICCALFLEPSPLLSQIESFPSSIDIYDREGTRYTISPVTSLSELLSLPEPLLLDRRIAVQDDEENRSCFLGASLDPHFNRSLVFFLRADTTIVGVATLLVSPSHIASKRKYFIESEDTLRVQPFGSVFPLFHQDTFLVEVGWVQVLPQHRSKGIGAALIVKAIIPLIQQLITIAPRDIIVLCSAQGASSQEMQETLLLILHSAAEKSESDIRITPPLRYFVGRVNSEALFTPATAQKLGLKRLENAFDYTLGPVFANVFHR